MIAFDRSGSMNGDFGGGTRYTVERDLLTRLVTEYQDRIRWGYEQFPIEEKCGDNCCQASTVTVAPALNNAMAIVAALRAAAAPSGRTPTPLAIRRCREFYAGFRDGINERYVLLSTDGRPNCGLSAEQADETDACDLTVSEVQKLLAEGIRTFALGVADDGTLARCLERVGAAGGAPRPGAPPSYYAARDPAALEAGLREIIKAIVAPSCIVELSPLPPDPTRVVLLADGSAVPWDPSHAEGWDYEPSSTGRIRLYGSFCTRLSGGQIKRLEAKYGCPPGPATPPAGDAGSPPPGGPPPPTPPPSCPSGVTPCGDPSACPPATVCSGGCCVPWVP